MGQNQIPSEPEFQHPISIRNILEVYWWCFGGKNTCGWVEMRACMGLCQNRPKTEAEHPPRPPEASISPQILPVASYVMKIQSMSKKDHAQTFAQINPLWKNSPQKSSKAHSNLSRQPETGWSGAGQHYTSVCTPCFSQAVTATHRHLYAGTQRHTYSWQPLPLTTACMQGP